MALCGFGRAGKIHFSGIRTNPRCRLKYVVDLPEALKVVRAALEEYGMLDTVTLVQPSDYESIVLADSELDGVVITTPTNIHELYVQFVDIRAFLRFHSSTPHTIDIIYSRMVKHSLFAKKSRILRVVYCYEIAEKHGCPLYTAFQRRFDKGMCKLRNQVVKGKVGKVFQVKSTSRDQPRPSIEYLKLSGGMFHDTAIHDIDFVCWTVRK